MPGGSPRDNFYFKKIQMIDKPTFNWEAPRMIGF